MTMTAMAAVSILRPNSCSQPSTMASMSRSFFLSATLALVFLSPAPARAQGAIMFGPMGGLSLANVYGDSVDALKADGTDITSRTGFAAGVFLRIGGSHFSIEPQALYVQKGATLKTTVLPITAHARAAYIE